MIGRSSARASLAVIAMAVALAACGGGTDGGASTVQAQDAQATSTSTAAAGAATSSTGAPSSIPTTSTSRPAAVGDERVCEIASAMLLRPPGIRREAEMPTFEEQSVMLQEVAEVLPEDQQEGWADLIESTEVQPADTSEAAIERDRRRFEAIRHRAARWARTQCPDAPPSWVCEAEVAWRGPPSDPYGTERVWGSPEEALEAVGGATGAVHLGREGPVVLFGWLDADGFLVRTVHVRETIDGTAWEPVQARECPG